MTKLLSCITALIFWWIGFVLTGCVVVVNQRPSISEQREGAATKRERLRREYEEKDRARRLSELIREKDELREEEESARRAAQAEKELQTTLVAKRYPGIEGEVLESRLLNDIYFEVDRYDILPEEALTLEENAAFLMKYPEMKVQIEGHCDERGTNEYNLALGERRANSTKKHLVSLGISSGRISTISYGEERPYDPGHNEEAWANNRRAHMVILSR